MTPTNGLQNARVTILDFVLPQNNYPKFHTQKPRQYRDSFRRLQETNIQNLFWFGRSNGHQWKIISEILPFEGIFSEFTAISRLPVRVVLRSPPSTAVQKPLARRGYSSSFLDVGYCRCGLASYLAATPNAKAVQTSARGSKRIAFRLSFIFAVLVCGCCDWLTHHPLDKHPQTGFPEGSGRVDCGAAGSGGVARWNIQIPASRMTTLQRSSHHG